MFISLVRNKLLWVAVLPPLMLLFYIYKMDRVEKESPLLLLKIFFGGVLACVPAVIAEYIGEAVLEAAIGTESDAYFVLDAFVVVAFSEEFFKFVAAKKRTWNSPEFNYRFDGIVYAVFASLGFATLENILYVLQYGLKTGFVRAVLAIPGHMMFGVFMGIFYGKARELYTGGRFFAGRLCNILSVAVPTILHGTYDYCIFSETRQTMTFFVCYVVIAYIFTFFKIHRCNKKDYRIW